MSTLSDCCTPCPTVTAVNVPGTNGANNYTLTTANFVVPTAGTNVTVSVANTGSLVVGQIVIIGSGSSSYGGPANFKVITIVSATSVTLQFLNYSGDVAAAQTINAGATVTPAGVAGPNSISTSTTTVLTGYLKGTGAVVAAQAVPIPVTDGGTGAITAAAARAALGAAASGANSDITSLSALSTPLSLLQGGTGVASVAAILALLTIKSGTATLASGTFTVSTQTVSSTTSIILVTLKTPAGTRTGFAGYSVSSIVTGSPGQFVITAINDSAATLSSCTDVVTYHIIG
jgi:hypothetical protein